MNLGLAVRSATIDDLASIKALADENRSDLGFVLKPALQKSIDDREILVADAHDRHLLAYLRFHIRRDFITKIYEICTSTYWRRHGIATKLLNSLCSVVFSEGSRVVELKCPLDAEAENLYLKTGFSRIRIDQGKRRRLGVWQMLLSE